MIVSSLWVRYVLMCLFSSIFCNDLRGKRNRPCNKSYAKLASSFQLAKYFAVFFHSEEAQNVFLFKKDNYRVKVG